MKIDGRLMIVLGVMGVALVVMATSLGGCESEGETEADLAKVKIVSYQYSHWNGHFTTIENTESSRRAIVRDQLGEKGDEFVIDASRYKWK